MSSSDSDDGGYYRNLVRKIEKNRNKILSKEIHSLAFHNSTKLNTPVKSKTINNSHENQPNVSTSSVDLIDEGTNILDEFIAKNRKNPLTRRNVRRGRASQRARKTNNVSVTSFDLIDKGTDILDEFIAQNKKTPLTKRNARRGKTKKSNNVSVSSNDSINEETNILDESIAKKRETLVTRNTAKRGKDSKRARKSQKSVHSSEIENLPKGLGVSESENAIISKCRKRKKTSITEDFDSNPILPGSQNSRTVYSRSPIHKRGGRVRARGRGRGRNNGRCRSPLLYVDPGLDPIRPPTNIYPIFSVGNTEEYYDHSDNIPLFSTKLTSDCANDVVTIDEADPLRDNEELLVKVLWQSIDVFQFTIRKFQKLKQIFDYFVTEKKVNINNLLFTYNDKILSCDDTPESINYSIAKFINGGIVTENVMSLVDEKNENMTGIEIKFQSCNSKNTYKVLIQNNEKLSLAMMKCAEHLDMPLSKLKFEFDGECITGNNTPEEMDFEGGECIDVKIVK